MNDRLIRGGLAGMVGELWAITWNLFSNRVLHFAKATWTNIMTQMVLGHPNRSTLDFIVSIAMILLFGGIVGGLFVRFVVPERDGNYILRGIGLGLATWFVFEILGTIFHIPGLQVVHAHTTLSNWIAVSGWGAITGWLTGRWDSLQART